MPLQTTIVPFWIFSPPWGLSWSLPFIKCYETLSIVLQALCLSDLWPIPARDAQRAQTPCEHQEPETSKRLRQNCVWVSPEEAGVISGLPQGQGLWVQQTWVWHKPSWRRSPLTHQRGTRTYTGLGDRHLEGTNRMLWAPGPRRKQQWPFNYKLAVTKSIASDWTAKAFAVSFYGDWAPRCSSCWPSTISEGVQGGGRHSVLQGIWWAGV